ncbi:MAG TPA: ABC transporter substrate-binding protein [Syntrophorhabdaceae bacterium]|nr:ABC transporter substrate-binding protein [Syntrophorhabdaceae bacterium]
MRTMRRKSFDVSAGLLCCALIFAVCVPLVFSAETAKPKAPLPRYGGTMRVADRFDGISIGYPPKMPNSYSQRQAVPALETLFRLDKTGKATPWLATGFKEDAKGKTILLTLRKGVKFHDGTNFNAEAVKWNLDLYASVKTPGTEKFKSIDIVDEFAIRINLAEWDSTVTSGFTQRLGMMISPTAYKKNGEEWCASHPVGTGPFEFVSWEKGTSTVYKKFPGYWQKGKPYLDRIEYYAINDSITRLLSFKKGELEVLLSPDAKDLADLKKDGYAVNNPRVGSGAMSLMPDSANPKSPFSDLKVRQAAEHAIDTEKIVKTIYHGEAEPATQWIYKGHWAYNPAVRGYPYNPALAKKLLAQAGYPNGFKTKITYRVNPQSDLVFTAVQGYLAAVGIDAALEPIQQERYNKITQEGGSWEGLIEDMFSPYVDVVIPMSQMYSGGNRYFTQTLAPADYVKAIQDAVGASDFKIKQKSIREAMKLMSDKYCLQILLLCQSMASVSQPYVHNHGFYETPAITWTPEDSWLGK